MSNAQQQVILCPGQGAQTVGMGRAWSERSDAARAVFDEADRVLESTLGARLSDICFNGPADRLNRTDISQPAIYACSVASWRGLRDRDGDVELAATAGLSLGEYTALHLAGVFDFDTGLELVAERGRLMQEAAEASDGSMLAIIGADESQAEEICRQAAGEDVLVCANFNAPGQIVLSGHAAACERAVNAAAEAGVRATPLTVAGAFHSPLMQPAAEAMASIMGPVAFSAPACPVWSNVTGEPHEGNEPESIKQRLVEQIVSPVRWSQGCCGLVSTLAGSCDYHELAPGTVLRGLMRRIDRSVKVTSHDEPE